MDIKSTSGEARSAMCKLACDLYDRCSHIGSVECNRLKQMLDGKQAVAQASAEDVVNNPQHYKHGTFEVIDEMIIAFGPQKTYDFCILNAWKYRSRAPYKGKPEEDMEKADRYMQMAKQIADANQDVFIRPCRLIKNGADG